MDLFCFPQLNWELHPLSHNVIQLLHCTVSRSSNSARDVWGRQWWSQSSVVKDRNPLLCIEKRHDNNQSNMKFGVMFYVEHISQTIKRSDNNFYHSCEMILSFAHMVSNNQISCRLYSSQTFPGGLRESAKCSCPKSPVCGSPSKNITASVSCSAKLDYLYMRTVDSRLRYPFLRGGTSHLHDLHREQWKETSLP